MIELTHDGEPAWEVAERCCLCRTPTRFWFTPKDVACCPECGATATPDMLPSKTEWLAKEDALSPKMPSGLR